MYCINAVDRSGGSRYKDDGPRLKSASVMQETARPFEADGCGTARNAVRATGRSGACGVVLLLYPGKQGAGHGTERTGKPRTAEAAPGITIQLTNPTPGGKT